MSSVGSLYDSAALYNALHGMLCGKGLACAALDAGSGPTALRNLWPTIDSKAQAWALCCVFMPVVLIASG